MAAILGTGILLLVSIDYQINPTEVVVVGSKQFVELPYDSISSENGAGWPSSTPGNFAESQFKSTGQVTRPLSLSNIFQPEFVASGTALVGAGETLWLVEKRGQMMWPKEPPITQSGNWDRVIYTGGPPGNFGLAMIAVNQIGNEAIQEFFRFGLTVGRYPGIRSEKLDHKVVDEISLKLI